VWFLVAISCLKEAYSDWLASLSWDFFLTITFRNPVPMRRQETVTHAVGKSITAHFDHVKRLALFAEPHLSQNLHLHGLINFDTPERLMSATRDCLQAYLGDRFGFSRAEVPRGHNAVSKYVAKYCVKTDGYYEFF